MSSEPIKLLTDQGCWLGRVNTSDLADVHDTILADPEVLALDNTKEGRVERVLSRVLNRLSRLNRDHLRAIHLMQGFPKLLKGHHLAVLIGIRPLQCLPHFPFARHKSILLFDPWPNIYDQIHQFAREHRLEHIFFTSKQATDHFRASDGCFASHWIPEAVKPGRYRFRDPADRDIDVLQFGRKWDAYHDRIVEHLAATGRTYLYEIDMDDPAGQLDEILGNYERYLPLIERNYREICGKHQWRHRWEVMRATLRGESHGGWAG